MEEKIKLWDRIQRGMEAGFDAAMSAVHTITAKAGEGIELTRLTRDRPGRGLHGRYRSASQERSGKDLTVRLRMQIPPKKIVVARGQADHGGCR